MIISFILMTLMFNSNGDTMSRNYILVTLWNQRVKRQKQVHKEGHPSCFNFSVMALFLVLFSLTSTLQE